MPHPQDAAAQLKVAAQTPAAHITGAAREVADQLTSAADIAAAQLAGAAPVVGAPAPAATQLAEEERDLVRQGERTVDNLKRLFAFVFAISFGVIATGAIEKLSPNLTDLRAPPHSLGTWLLDIEMLAVFVITAGVFFHQGAKFLDNRYARQPLPFGVAWDYLTLVVTMIPFFFMAQAFRPSVTHNVGYTWFLGFMFSSWDLV